MSKKRSDTEVLNHFVTYEPPPRGFDPLTARAILLRKHGFPRRPRPEKERRLHELWQRAFSRPMKFIKAELAVARRDRPRPTGPCDLRGKWAGAVVNPASLFPPEPGAANFVYGQWILPSVVPPSNPPQGLPVGFWVGLGGVGAENSFNVVQAGTQAVVDRNHINYSAFTEWTPDFAVTVNNFPVDAGDHVEFL